MRKSTIKSLLLGVLMAAGASSAWAGETTTTYGFEDGKTIFTIADANRMSQSIVDDATLESKVNKFTCGNMNAVAFAYYDFSSLVSNASNVSVEFDFNIAEAAGHALISLSDANYHTLANGGFAGKSNTGYGSNGAIFNLGCVRGGGANKFGINTAQTNLAGLGAWCHAKVDVDVKNKKVSYTITDANSDVLASAEKIAFLNSNASACTQIDVYIGTNAAGNQVLIDNLSITSVVDESATYADYKVVWYNETAEEDIKSETRNGQVGSLISLSDNDKANFYNSDKSVKYIYTSDDLGEKTIAKDGSTVVTINFREADTYDYTVNAVDAESNVLMELASGSSFEGDVSTTYWNKYIKVDDQWYVTESPYGVDLTEAGTFNVTYNPAEIDYFFDISSMKQGHSSAASTTGKNYSNGDGFGPYAGANMYSNESLAGGIYTLYVFSGSRRSGTVTMGISVRDKNGIISETGKEFTWTVAGTETHEATVEGIEIPEGCQIVLVEKTGYNSVAYLDYITLNKTADIASETIPVTTDAGYITYVTKNAIQIPSDIEAYVVCAVSDKSVALSQVDEVPAGTPIIVKAAKSETGYECEVVASAEEPAVNHLKVSNGSVSGDGTIYALAKKDVVGFYPVAEGVTVPAGKAYIEVEKEEAPVKGYFALGDEADAINNIAVESVNGAIYNIAGQKMESIKNGGLYIVNGKKVIVK